MLRKDAFHFRALCNSLDPVYAARPGKGPLTATALTIFYKLIFWEGRSCAKHALPISGDEGNVLNRSLFAKRA
jgi:hypothetical protein